MAGRSLLVGLAALVGICVFVPKPDLDADLSFSRAVYDRDDHLLRLTLSSDERFRLPITLEEVSRDALEATLLQEDRYFYSHPGFNPYSLLRAAWHTFVARDRTIGGSTITMQLARLHFHLDTRSVTGKLSQILRAIQIEMVYSKREILEAYLSRVPYGGNVEGIGAASIVYFGKSASHLSPAEALTLACLPPSPTRRASSTGSDLGFMRAYEALVATWCDEHPETSDLLVSELPTLAARDSLPFRAPHMTDAVLQRWPRDAAIKTTLDSTMQGLAERALHQYVERRQESGIRNGSILLVHYPSMEVRAWVGSANYFDAGMQGQVDGTRARRSPGSAVKPFIYALGIEQGLIHPATVLEDTPAQFGAYDPENFDTEFTGLITARDALVRSRNIPAIRLAARLEDPTFYEFLQELEIARLREETFYGLATVLGGVEMTMAELVRGYAMLANEGMLRPLSYRVDDPSPAGRRLLAPESTALVLDMLRSNPRPEQAGTFSVPLGNTPVAWKTGTSNGFRDAWTVGVFGPYVLAVWIGEFSGAGNTSFLGLGAAAPLFFELVDAIETEGNDIVRDDPSAVPAAASVCSLSGKLPGPHCPHTITTPFFPGRSPLDLCDVHRDGATEDRSQAFLSSGVRALLRSRGIQLADSSHAQGSVELGRRPEITSPRQGVVHSVRAARVGRDTIPFVASIDGDSNEVYWFLDHEFLGRSPPSEPYEWVARPGDFVVRAIDSRGRNAARRLDVEVVP